MYRKSIRPMNDAERAQVEARINLQRPDKPSGLWRRLRDRLSGQADFLNRVYEFRKTQISLFREIAADGHVVVHSINSSAVARIDECEDEGASFFFDIGGRRMFCFCCWQWSDDPDRVWPNDDFEIAESRKHPDHYFKVYCHGSRLNPVRTIEGTHELWDRLPMGCEVIDGTPATLEHDLFRLPERPPIS
jgi:hypothetical protein